MVPLLLLCALGIGGCGNGGGLNALIGDQQRQDIARSRVHTAAVAMNGGNNNAADSAIAEAVNLLKGDSAAYAQIALWLIDDGRPTEAAKLLTAVTNREGMAWNPALWNALARAQSRAGNKTAAEEARRQADIRADAVAAKIGAGKPTSDGSLSENTIHFLVTGSYYNDKNDLLNALKAFEEALRLSPNSPVTMNALGYILADKGTTPAQFNRAIELTHEAVRLTPSDPTNLDSYGWALFKKGDLPGARRVLREAADGSPSQPEILYHLGKVYVAQGLTEEASLQFDRAVSLRPDFPEAKAAQSLLKTASAKPTAHNN